MTLTDTTVDGKLCQFLKEYDGDQCSLELIIFLGRHPNTRFSRLAIVHALNARRLDIERALRHLKEKGLVTAYPDNGTAVYSLTDDESLRTSVLDLLKISWWDWQPGLRQFYSLHS